jgi:hypothetical protein
MGTTVSDVTREDDGDRTGRIVAYSQVLHSLYGSEYVFYSDHIPYQNMAWIFVRIPWYYLFLYALEYWWYSGVLTHGNTAEYVL